MEEEKVVFPVPKDVFVAHIIPHVQCPFTLLAFAHTCKKFYVFLRKSAHLWPCINHNKCEEPSHQGMKHFVRLLRVLTRRSFDPYSLSPCAQEAVLFTLCPFKDPGPQLIPGKWLRPMYEEERVIQFGGAAYRIAGAGENRPPIYLSCASEGDVFGHRCSVVKYYYRQLEERVDYVDGLKILDRLSEFSGLSIEKIYYKCITFKFVWIPEAEAGSQHMLSVAIPLDKQVPAVGTVEFVEPTEKRAKYKI